MEPSFHGWLAPDSNAVHGSLVYQAFEPKRWTERDVDIKISHCGICGTDLHTLHDFMKTTKFPCVVGHEIAGEVIRAGKETKLQPGDRVAVGAQSDNCGQSDCHDCSQGQENYCPRWTMTYNSTYSDGSASNGGFASHCRVPARWAFKLPSDLPSKYAAPLLCAGITMYSPLKRAGIGPGKGVGVVGLGGLGHFGVLFAKAMGARVVVISRGREKEADAMSMGADAFVSTKEDMDWGMKHASSLDLIIDTGGAIDEIPNLLLTLRAQGEIVLVGAPTGMEAKLNPWLLIMRGTKYGGSVCGSHTEVEEMLEFASKAQLKPWVEERPMASVNEAIVDFAQQKPRYRYVLFNEAST